VDALIEIFSAAWPHGITLSCRAQPR